MRILSLFDGISCARVALERVGIPVEAYYASEIDKYAMQISNKNYPDIVQLGSVIGVSYKNGWLSNDVGMGGMVNRNIDIDLLMGGSPCQDLSIAKKNRQGLDGERSGLFWEYVRILKEVKPKYFVLENVNSMPKEAKAIITETLGVEPIMINAALVSAQNRKRLFWTNIPNVTQPADKGILLKDILEENVDEKYSIKGVEVTNQGKTVGKDLEKSHSLMARDYKGFGNQAMTGIQRLGQIGKGGQGDRIYSPEGKSVGLSALGGGGGAKTGLYAVPVALRNRGDGKKPEYNGTGKANSMTTVQTDSMVQENSIIRKLTPIECERLQGLGFYELHKEKYERYLKENVDVVAHILSFIPYDKN